MTRSSPQRLAFLIALMCAMSLRLLTPPGWMPNFEGRGGAPLVICTGDGVHTIRPGDHGSHLPAKAAHEVCAFAGFALGATPDVVHAAAPATLGAPGEASPLAAQVRPAPTWRRPQAARAPPSFA